jgi:pimeloyl-ACP methyl ester carboxylesterase
MIVIALFLAACGPADEAKLEEIGAQKRAHFPFPSMHIMKDGVVNLPNDLPYSTDGTPVAIEKLRWREGFSVAQSAVVDLDFEVDPASLPGQSLPMTDGTVQLWDLTSKTPILCFAELDSAERVEGEFPVLIVRPQDVMIPGHQIAVVLTNGVKLPGGAEMPVVDWYADLQRGVPGPDLGEWVEHYQSLEEELKGLGVEGITLAFDFPISDGGAPVRHLATETGVPGEYSINEVRSTDDGVLMPEGGWQQLYGTYTVDNWLVDDLYFELDGDGLPIRQGTVEAELSIYIPESARGAEPGTVPVWLFGHGLFGSPDVYLRDRDDPSRVAKLADEAGAIVFATVWRGFKNSDRIHAIQISEDFGRIYEIAERLSQGVANVVALSRLIVEGSVLDDPALLGLADKSGELRYYGISLGGIAGAVTLANNPRITHGVFNVGGGAWSTMLERSSQWIPFDWIMVEMVPSNRDRQLMYALSQLFWDPVDPMNHVEGLRGRSVVWQEAIGDEQVPNMTTRMLARAVGATQLQPMVEPVVGLASGAGPIELPGYVQFDPELEMPTQANQPGVPSGAHGAPRTWPGTRQQIVRFNDWEDPGLLLHFCGDAPCSESNPGAE